jgi:hypothetical protein
VAIPETPLRAVELSKRVTANPAVSKTVYAACELCEIGESHRDVEPIQHVLRLRRHLLMNRSQAGVAIGENSDRSGVRVSVFLIQALAQFWCNSGCFR